MLFRSHTPVNIVILQGQGIFAGSDGVGRKFGPETMLLFDPGEPHSIEALDEQLVFLVILHEAPNPNK